MGEEFQEHVVETIRRQVPGHGGDCGRKPAVPAGEHGVLRRRQKLAFEPFIDDLKPGNDAGLYRKALQQSFAEGVNGLDLEPARRFESGCEEPSRTPDIGRRLPLAGELS